MPALCLAVRRLAAAWVLLSALAVAAAARETPDPPKPPAPQSWAERQSAACSVAIDAAEKRYALPSGLLRTMGKVESGRPVNSLSDIRAWPWTVDADGQGMFFDSKAAAIVWTELMLNQGARFVDVGCLQVDLAMHPHAFRSLDEAFAPAANVDYAARYLKALYAEAGNNWYVAVGLYHSHTPELAADYRERVAAVGAGIVTGIGGPEPLYLRAVRQGRLRIALVGGGVQLINVNRQPTQRRHPRLSACEVAAILRPLLARPPNMHSCRVAGR